MAEDYRMHHAALRPATRSTASSIEVRTHPVRGLSGGTPKSIRVVRCKGSRIDSS